MAVSGKHLYVLAGEVYNVATSTRANSNKHQVLLRTVINRAYYGAFIESRDHKSVSTRDNVHLSVANAYIGSPIGNYLNSLRKLRQKADYEFGADAVEKEAQTALKLARKVLAELNIEDVSY